MNKHRDIWLAWLFFAIIVINLLAIIIYVVEQKNKNMLNCVRLLVVVIDKKQLKDCFISIVYLHFS